MLLPDLVFRTWDVEEDGGTAGPKVTVEISFVSKASGKLTLGE